MVPTNSIGTIDWIELKSPNPIQYVTKTPSANGTTTPPMATAVAGFNARMNAARLVSNPASNRSRIAAICATYRIDVGSGNDDSVASCASAPSRWKTGPTTPKKSMPPSRYGLIRMPAPSSPSTDGIFRYLVATSPPIFAAISITDSMIIN